LSKQNECLAIKVHKTLVVIYLYMQFVLFVPFYASIRLQQNKLSGDLKARPESTVTLLSDVNSAGHCN